MQTSKLPFRPTSPVLMLKLEAPIPSAAPQEREDQPASYASSVVSLDTSRKSRFVTYFKLSHVRWQEIESLHKVKHTQVLSKFRPTRFQFSYRSTKWMWWIQQRRLFAICVRIVNDKPKFLCLSTILQDIGALRNVVLRSTSAKLFDLVSYSWTYIHMRIKIHISLFQSYSKLVVSREVCTNDRSKYTINEQIHIPWVCRPSQLKAPLTRCLQGEIESITEMKFEDLPGYESVVFHDVPAVSLVILSPNLPPCLILSPSSL